MKIKNLFIRHFQNNFIFYFTLFISLILGVIIGAIFVKSSNFINEDSILRSVNPFFKTSIMNSYNSIEILKLTFWRKFLLTLFIWLMGLLFIGIFIIPVIIGINGFFTGYIVGYFVLRFGIRGFFLALGGIFPQNLIYMPCIIAIGSISMSLSYNNKNNRKFSKPNYTKDTMEYSILIVLILLVVFLGCLIESFISPIFLNMTFEYL